MTAAEELVPDARAGLSPRELVARRVIRTVGYLPLPRRRGPGRGCAVGLILLLILLILILGSVPAYPYSANWGYAPSGLLGLVLVVLLVLLLLRAVPWWF